MEDGHFKNLNNTFILHKLPLVVSHFAWLRLLFL